jgi:arylformamidase
MKSMKMIDVTRPIFTGMTVWPGDEDVLLERVSNISDNSATNVSRIRMGVHAGTHVDAPLHFINGGKSIDQLDINLFTGWVQIVDTNGADNIQLDHITRIPLQKGDAVFFKTPYSEKTLNEDFDTEYSGLSIDAALYLLSKGVRVIGTDALSIEGYHDKSHSVHKTLLTNEVLIVEGLCLKDVSSGRYKYICMPMLIQGSDGAPARVLLFA